MKKVYVVTVGAKNMKSTLQFAFHNSSEAEKFREYLDHGKGVSGNLSTIHVLQIHDAAIQLMRNKN